MVPYITRAFYIAFHVNALRWTNHVHGSIYGNCLECISIHIFQYLNIGWHNIGMIPHLRIEIVTLCGTSVASMLCLRYTLTTKHGLLCNSWMVDTDGWLIRKMMVELGSINMYCSNMNHWFESYESFIIKSFKCWRLLIRGDSKSLSKPIPQPRDDR